MHTIIKAVALALLVSSTSLATVLTFNMNDAYTGSDPEGTPPWMRATFTNITGGVEVKLDAFNLTGSEFVSNWFFNVADAFTTAGAITVGQISKTGSFTSPNPAVKIAKDYFDAGGGSNFDMLFQFSTGGGLNERFTDDDVYTIQLFGTGLDVTAFNLLSVHNNPNKSTYRTAAHIQSIQIEDSGWVTGSTRIVTDNDGGDGDQNPVPDSGSLVVLLGLVFAALGTLRRKLS